jgi:aquaporin related protein
MVGAIVAAAIIDGLTEGKLSVTCTLGNGTSRTQGLFIEMFGTAALVLSVLMLAAGKSNTPISQSSPAAGFADVGA